MESQERGKHSEKGRIDIQDSLKKRLLDRLAHLLKDHSPEELERWKDHLNDQKDIDAFSDHKESDS